MDDYIKLAIKKQHLFVLLIVAKRALTDESFEYKTELQEWFDTHSRCILGTLTNTDQEDLKFTGIL